MTINSRVLDPRGETGTIIRFGESRLVPGARTAIVKLDRYSVPAEFLVDELRPEVR